MNDHDGGRAWVESIGEGSMRALWKALVETLMEDQ
jgi:hypothetical protein